MRKMPPFFFWPAAAGAEDAALVAAGAAGCAAGAGALHAATSSAPDANPTVFKTCLREIMHDFLEPKFETDMFLPPMMGNVQTAHAARL